MKVDLGSVKKFEIVIGDKTFALSEPSVKQVMDYKDKSESDQAAIFGFLHELGLPLEVASSLSIGQLKKLVDALVGSEKNG
jgi:hypothetical protein